VWVGVLGDHVTRAFLPGLEDPPWRLRYSPGKGVELQEVGRFHLGGSRTLCNNLRAEVVRDIGGVNHERGLTCSRFSALQTRCWLKLFSTPMVSLLCFLSKILSKGFIKNLLRENWVEEDICQLIRTNVNSLNYYSRNSTSRKIK
jgi:hypothetical protein